MFLKQQTARPAAEARDRVPLEHAPTGSVEARALLDTGALGGDFISGELVRRLNGEKFIYNTKREVMVCSGLDNACYATRELIDIGVEFLTENNITKIISLSARISATSSIDLIVGRPTIKKHNFWKLTPSHFGTKTTHTAEIDDTETEVKPLKRKFRTEPTNETETNTVSNRDIPSTEPKPPLHPHKGLHLRKPKSTGTTETLAAIKPKTQTPALTTCGCQSHPRSDHPEGLEGGRVDRVPPTEKYGGKRVAFAETRGKPERATFPTCTHTLVSAISETADLNSRRFTAPDEIDDEKTDTFAPFLTSQTQGEEKPHFLDLITFEGDATLQRDLRALCTEFGHIFSDELGEQPADIPPFEIKVNLEKWETYKNKGPVRPQTAQKEAEISKHVADMLKTGVIEPSRAIYTNHPVIVKKADGNFRFCIDFRNLNDCTEGGSWPLPNIKGTFARIGEKKPDIFGVMDLTSGYHQAPLHPAAKIFTAFICFAGVYQFTRLPFGPKRAPSYFQQMMTSVVLFGLIYIVCEMYLDDCIVSS